MMKRRVAGLSHKARRLILIALLALALSPGLFWRSALQEGGGRYPVIVRSLALPANEPVGDGITIAGGWHIRSDDPAFGGYSALLLRPDGRLLALSDRGRFLRIDKPTHSPIHAATGAIGGADDHDKRLYDVESATQDETGETIWLGYESFNRIVSYDRDLNKLRQVRPPEMREWPGNSGPESLVRLRDGRFVVLAEALTDDQSGSFCEGLLFPGDPVDGARPESFRFVPPAGFRPTDIAQLPDGRVLILLRGWRIGFPPLSSRLVIADPAMIEPGKEWDWEPLLEIRSPLPHENYEGLAIEPRDEGAVRLWIISDDNGAVFQRTLLLALDWKPAPRT